MQISSVSGPNPEGHPCGHSYRRGRWRGHGGRQLGLGGRQRRRVVGQRGEVVLVVRGSRARPAGPGGGRCSRCGRLPRDAVRVAREHGGRFVGSLRHHLQDNDLSLARVNEPRKVSSPQVQYRAGRRIVR